MLVVNLFGVPGAGKSTGAAYVFSNLKMQGINAELVTEFAKDMVWENNTEVLKNQAYIFGTQSFRISRCQNKVDVIVTDCPLLLTALYNRDPILGREFNNVVANVFRSYNNVNFLLDRAKEYNPIGRLQTEQEAQSLRTPLLDLLNTYNIPFSRIDGNKAGYDSIVKNICQLLEKEKHSEKIHKKRRDCEMER